MYICIYTGITRFIYTLERLLYSNVLGSSIMPSAAVVGGAQAVLCGGDGVSLQRGWGVTWGWLWVSFGFSGVPLAVVGSEELSLQTGSASLCKQ